MNTLLVSNHFVTVQGFISIVKRLSNGVRLVALADNFIESSNIFRTNKADGVVFGTSALTEGGIPALRSIGRRYPHIKLYAMMHTMDKVLFEYLYQVPGITGVFSVATKADEIGALLLRKAFGGHPLLSSDVENFVCDERINSSIEERVDLLRRLSRREYDVLLLSLDGLRSKEIANKLNISPKTVCTHRAHIKEKFGVRHMVQVCKIALDVRHTSAMIYRNLEETNRHSF